MIKLINRIILSIIFLIITITSVYAQEENEFLGVLELNDKSLISYRLIFTENNGKINGFSITDLQGEHETKNIITGSYNKRTKIMIFKEEDIVFTKSPIIQEDFCFVNFEGKLKLSERKSKLNGDFKGLFEDNQECINGSIKLVGSERLYKKMNKLNKRITRTKRVDEATKRKVNPVKILDSLRINTLKEGENTSVFWKSNEFKMDIWDAGKEDGDIISILVNGKKVLNNYTISHKKKTISFSLEANKNSIVIIAENIGKIAPNTAKILLVDGSKEIGLYSNLNSKKSTKISVIKRK